MTVDAFGTVFLKFAPISIAPPSSRCCETRPPALATSSPCTHP